MSSKVTQYFRENACVKPLKRFNKVVDLQYCKYIKKRLQHRCFLRNLQKCLRIPFLTNIREHQRTSASLSGLLGWVKVKKITEIVVKARSSHRRCSMKKAFLKYFAIFTGKRLCWSLLIKFINYKL